MKNRPLVNCKLFVSEVGAFLVQPPLLCKLLIISKFGMEPTNPTNGVLEVGRAVVAWIDGDVVDLYFGMHLDIAGKTRLQTSFYTTPFHGSVKKSDFVAFNSLDIVFVLPNLSQISSFGNLLVNSDLVKVLGEPTLRSFLLTLDEPLPN